MFISLYLSNHPYSYVMALPHSISEQSVYSLALALMFLELFQEDSSVTQLTQTAEKNSSEHSCKV